jgi:DNA-binding beta-propeller fold protein YncE
MARSAGRSAVGTHRTRRRHVSILAVLTGGLLLVLCSAPAMALTQRGHVYSAAASFGKEGSGVGELKQPAGVAVNEASGDVYVVDAGNNRIDRFDSAHHFIAAWGWGVKDGQKQFEVCTTGCQAGIAGHAKGEFHGAEAIAIDNSTDKADPSAGDVYVEAVTPYEEEINGHEVEDEYGTFDKFSPSGELLAQIKTYKEKGETAEKFEEPHGIAVGPTGTVLIYNEEAVVELTNGQPNKFLAKVGSEAEGEGRPGIAVDATGDIYLAHEGPGSGEEVPTVVAKEEVFSQEGELIGEPLIESLDGENSTAVAVDEANGDAVVDHGNAVAVFDSGGTLVERIGVGQLHAGSGVAAPNSGELLVADSASGKIEAFVPEPSGAPQLDEIAAEKITGEGAQLDAEINARGLATEYVFRYDTGAVPTAGEACAGSCVEVPVPKAILGASFGDQSVQQAITGLAPATSYHYRVIAYNADATGGVASPEQHFRTQLALLGATLPDGRVWELVSPEAKNGAAIEAPTIEGGLIEASESGEGITYVARGALPGAEGNRAPEPTQILSFRGAGSWSSTDVDTKNETAEGLAPGSAGEYRAFSEDLVSSLVQPYGNEPFERPALSKAATERTPYLRSDGAVCTVPPAPESCFTPLVNSGNVPEVEVGGKKELTKFGGKIKYVGADPSLQHIVLQSKTPLSSEPAASGENLYEWAEAQMHLVNVLPDGTPGSSPQLGESDRDVLRAVSTDGSRLIFSAGTLPKHLYMRDMALGQTVQVDLPEVGTEAPEHAKPVFQSASADDSKIFFTDEQRLTSTSTASSHLERPDLYECEVLENAATHTLECKLTDLSVDGNAGESANVQGVVPQVGDDGSAVYFVANGALASGALPGHCIPGEEGRNTGRFGLTATCSLYVDRYDAGSRTWSAPKLIATLSAEDEADWGDQSKPGYFGSLTARVSPDGNLLTFMSDRSLTGYPNRDVTSGKFDEEVYLYDAGGESLLCASCNPSGARPHGVLDTEFAGEGQGLLVDRPLTWQNRWLSGSIAGWTKAAVEEAPYPSRYLYDDGRLFFTSAEALVAQDTNGKEDVYEFEPTGVGGCTTASETFGETSGGCVSLISAGTSTHESAFLDASATGNDVFLLTASTLVAEDKDSSFDVYDADLCGQSGTHACLPVPAASLPPCEDLEHCRPDATSPAPFAPPGTTTPAASGNISPQHEVLGEKSTAKPKPKALTRSQKFSKALKACRKLRQHKKRHSCEVQAKKKYGPIKKTAKKSAFHGASVRGR